MTEWAKSQPAEARQSFFADILTLAGGTALGQALIVLSSPLLTRLYDPESFGTLAVYVSLLSILLVVASWRYELAIPLAPDDTSAANVLTVSFLALLGMCVLSWVAVRVSGKWITQLTGSPYLEPHVYLLPLSLLGAGITQVLSFWAIRKKDFANLAKTKISQCAVQTLVHLGLGLMKAGTLGLLLGDVVGRASASGTLGMLELKKGVGNLGNVSLLGMSEAVRRYRRFPIFSSWSALLNIAGTVLPPLFLAALYNAHVAGLFAIAQRVVGLPMLLVGQSVSQVYFAEASRLAREEPSELRMLFWKTCQKLFFWGVFPTGFLVLGGPHLFALVFGKGWDQAGSYVRILGIMFLAQFAIAPLSQTLNLLERQHWQLIWDAARLALIISGFILAKTLEFVPAIAVAIYSCCMFVSYLLLLRLCLNAIMAGTQKKDAV